MSPIQWKDSLCARAYQKGKEMNWITDFLAIGNIEDANNRENLRNEKIDLVMDCRIYFDENMSPIRSIWSFIHTLLDLTKDGNRVLVHCHGGLDRSPFIAVLYVFIQEKLDFPESYKWVKNRHPQTIEHYEMVEFLKKDYSIQICSLLRQERARS